MQSPGRALAEPRTAIRNRNSACGACAQHWPLGAARSRLASLGAAPCAAQRRRGKAGKAGRGSPAHALAAVITRTVTFARRAGPARVLGQPRALHRTAALPNLPPPFPPLVRLSSPLPARVGDRRSLRCPHLSNNRATTLTIIELSPPRRQHR